MTVNYSGNFFKALFRWRGSVWKTVWKELTVWLVFYYALRIILLELPPSNIISSVIYLFRTYTIRLPLEFLLGFYVTQVVIRWWAQVSALPWPDEIMAHVCSVLYENDDETRSRRRSVGRYLIASLILAYRNVSTSVRKIFPTVETLQQIGLLTSEERVLLENSGYDDLHYELPLQWIHEVVRSKAGSTQGSLIFALNSLRGNVKSLIHHNAICFPLVYTQTVTVVVYGYFVFCLIGHQFYTPKVFVNPTDSNGAVSQLDQVDTIVPFLLILRFIFSVGWLKVAEDLGKPFGSDDDDVELIYWLNRHVRLVFTVSDYAFATIPQANWLNDNFAVSNEILIAGNYDGKRNAKGLARFKALVRLRNALSKSKNTKENKMVLPFSSENF